MFRYDLMWEFISAIVEGRPAVPSFYDGLNAQIVADAVLESHTQRRWVDTPVAEALGDRRSVIGLAHAAIAPEARPS